MRRLGFGMLLLALAPAPVPAQWVRANGSLTVYGELYDRQGLGPAARPDQTGRITANLTVSTLNGAVVMPLTALISTDQVSFRQEINQVGVSPIYKATTVHLGYFAPRYSTYTVADQTVLGGGLDTRAGPVRAGFAAGRARRAVAPDSAGTPVAGQASYRRMLYAARVGVGRVEGSFLDFSLMRAEDDPGSLDTSVTNALTITPDKNTVFGLKGRLGGEGSRLSLETEAAFSRYERDVTAEGAPDATGQAATARLRYALGDWSVGAAVEYLSSAFLTMGNAGLAPDRMDYSLLAEGRLWEGRLSFNATGGWRRNDLDDALDATTTQIIYSVSGAWQPVPAFGLNFQAGNISHDSRAKDDTSSIKNVTGTYGLTPRLTWRTGSAQQVLVVVANLQQSQNTSPLSVMLVDTRTTTLVGTWSASLPSSLSFTLTATRTAVELDTLPPVTVTTVAPGVARGFLGGRLQAQVQAQFTRGETATGKSEEVFPLFQVRYSVAPGQSVQLKTSVRHHELSGAGTFDERIVALQYSASWR